MKIIAWRKRNVAMKIQRRKTCDSQKQKQLICQRIESCLGASGFPFGIFVYTIKVIFSRVSRATSSDQNYLSVNTLAHSMYLRLKPTYITHCRHTLASMLIHIIAVKYD